MNIPFEQNSNQTATYEEIVEYYQLLQKESRLVQVTDFGMTDSGHPLQEVVLAKSSDFTPEKSKTAEKAILFINNGIHPGEPAGIDATMVFVRDLLKNEDLNKFLDHITIVIIPVYNIGGCINRSSFSRANQNGPVSYGFRGNAQNLDLNRDFIKCDTKNAISFNQLFTKWDPDVQIDTHTSNGADYAYTMTLIATQKDKLHPLLSDFMIHKMLPELYSNMEKDNWEMIPYVNADGPPENGIYGFMDLPRYSSGYAALHHTISFMPEAHMLKPYKDRVISTLAFIKNTTGFMYGNNKTLIEIRNKIKADIIYQEEYPLVYKLDLLKSKKLFFKGYTSGFKKSEVSGQDRLYYDQKKPWAKEILLYDEYINDVMIIKPKAYIIPRAYEKIVSLMQNNGVKVDQLEKDTEFNVEMYRIDAFETSKTPYEGHYLHSKIQVTKHKTKKQYFKGDYIIYTNQKTNRYIVETMEPQAPDSWFAWNFFDGILAQKEYYSDYVFEDLAADILKNDERLLLKLQEKRRSDHKFATDGDAQLDFIYRNSKYYEPTHMMYPIGRYVD